MKKYKKNKVRCCDAGELLDSLDDASIDLIVTDPPYGISFRSNMRTATPKFDAIKDDTDPNYSILKDFYRVLKDGTALYLYTRWDVYPKWKKEIEAVGFVVKNMCVWYKPGGGMGDLEGSYAPEHEICIFAHKGRHKIRGKRISDVWKLKKDPPGSYIHPTQKPIHAMELPILKSSDEGDLVLDPYSGSGSTGVACAKSNRRFIGCDIEEKYVNLANERIHIELSQMKLF